MGPLVLKPSNTNQLLKVGPGFNFSRIVFFIAIVLWSSRSIKVETEGQKKKNKQKTWLINHKTKIKIIVVIIDLLIRSSKSRGLNNHMQTGLFSF